jgi:prepilin-type N-terminal cleavage/methylation domain-containing protein
MNKKNGFTLVELLAVIVILAIVGSVATLTTVHIIKISQEKVSSDMRNTLKDTAITYAISSFKLKKCSVDFSKSVYEKGDISKYENNTDCARIITVKTLKEDGIFEDNQNHCKDSDEVIVYRYNDGENSEYKAYISDSACKNY